MRELMGEKLGRAQGKKLHASFFNPRKHVHFGGFSSGFGIPKISFKQPNLKDSVS